MNAKTLRETMQADPALLRDFADSLEDSEEEIRPLLARLDAQPADGAALAALLRLLHSAKGNARMVFQEEAVAALHALEERVVEVRAGHAPYLPALGVVVRETLARLREACGDAGRQFRPQWVEIFNQAVRQGDRATAAPRRAATAIPLRQRGGRTGAADRPHDDSGE